MIIIGSRTGELRLVRYAKNSSGVFGRTSVTTLLTGIYPGSAVDLSPDGTRIAYRAATGGALMVYDLNDRSSTEWLRGPWAWDFVWARGGASLVLLEQYNSNDQRSRLYELRAPGQAIEILNHRRLDAVEVSRLKSDELLLSYNSDDGSAHVGTWRMPTTLADGSTSAGEWIVPSLAGRSAAFKGVFSCDDKYLLYGGAGPSGQQIWLTKTLPSGADVAISKAAANAIPQSWSRCVTAPASSGSALEFRGVP
ncbi:WD40 repeat domain-containing protein [Sphingomonas sp. LHG3406-1]|uniref:WD40 repeat domain-containing protein n=1 Tax=Sphingomonas sp. LHG3406-1 TaxID=2804617 RepID=UPI0026345D8C|nr:WD40 repeat domain-containing protein [Sphingomonas sp. LHG3406-1]